MCALRPYERPPPSLFVSSAKVADQPITRARQPAQAMAQDALDEIKVPPAPSPSPGNSQSASRAGSRPGSAQRSQITAELKAEKLATIGMMLRKQGEPDALRHLAKSLHLNPAAPMVWKSLGHALAQDGQLAAARSTLTVAAAQAPPGKDIAARIGLATVLTQRGEPGAAMDELLKVRSSGSSGAAELTTEPIERLSRRLMPSHRFAAAQSAKRMLAWKNAMLATCTRKARVLDISSTPLPAILCARLAASSQVVIRAESLPMSVAMQVLKDNELYQPRADSVKSVTAPIQLITAGTNGLPQQPKDVVTQGAPEVLLADTDVHDILGSPYLSSIRTARLEMLSSNPVVLPSAIEVHVAIVESQELARLNSISTPISGLDLGALNALSHRSRAVRLSELKHTVLTGACTALQVKLDGAGPPKVEGQVSVDMQVERSGVAHAVVVWHTMRLHKSVTISTGPGTAEEADDGVRQVAYYLWSPPPGEPDWEREKQQMMAASDAAAQAADWASATASAAHAASAAASEVAAGSAEAATFAGELAAEADARAAPAKERIEYGAIPEHFDAALLEAAHAAAEMATSASHAAQRSAAIADVVRIAAGAASEAASKANEASLLAAAAAASVSDDAPAAAATAESAAWTAAQQAALAAEAVAMATHTSSTTAKDAEPPFDDTDGILDDDEVPAQPPQEQVRPEDDELNGAEAEGDDEEADDAGARAAAQAAAAAAAEAAAQVAQQRAHMRAAHAAREARFSSAAAARQAAADAATAAAAVMQGAEAAAKARALQGAVDERGPDATTAKVPSIGSVFLKKRQPLTLRMRYSPRRVEFQICGREEAKPAVFDTTLATGGATAGKPLMDAEGRIVTASGRLFILTAKLRIRGGVALDSAEVGVLMKGTRVHILELRMLKSESVDEDGEEQPGLQRALIQVKSGWTPLGWKTSLGWLSCKTKDGDDTLVPEDDDRAADYPEPPPPPPPDTLDAKIPEWMRSKRPGSAKKLVDDTDDTSGREATTQSPPSLVLLARSAPEVAHVSEQNFGSPSVSAPLSAYHFAMVNDKQRNDAFAAAIMKAVARSQPSLILDIGSGTGLLAMLAVAKAGARRVLAVEMTPELAAVATKLVNVHGLSHAVRVLPCHSSQVHLDSRTRSTDDEELGQADPWKRRADMLVFEILGTDPLCEGLLPTLRDARSRLLTKTASILPCALEVHMMLVQSEDLARLNSVVRKLDDVDLNALNEMSHQARAIRLSQLSHTPLTEARTVLSLQLDADEPPEVEGETEIEVCVKATGTAHAVVAWFTAQLDSSGSMAVSTAPGVAEPMRGHSWGQLAHFLVGGLQVTEHQTLRVRARWSDKGVSFTIIPPKPIERRRDTADLARAITGELAQIERQVTFKDVPANPPKPEEASDGTAQPPAVRYVLSSDGVGAHTQGNHVPEPPKTPKKPAGPVQFKRSASGKYRTERSGLPGTPP